MELLITSIEQSKLAKMSEVLTEHGIESDFSSDTLSLGDSFTTRPIYQYHLFVDVSKLEMANNLLIESKIFEDELNEFNDVQYPDEELSDDNVKGRNIGTLDDFDLPNVENEKYATKAKLFMIIIGYAIAILGGFLSIAVGGRFYYMKITDDNGNQVFAYDKYTRSHGLNMMILGAFMFINSLLIRYLIIKFR